MRNNPKSHTAVYHRIFVYWRQTAEAMVVL